MAEWRILGWPLSDKVARTIARWCGDWFGPLPNLWAFGAGNAFNLADALDECLMIAPASEDAVTALWEYLQDKRHRDTRDPDSVAPGKEQSAPGPMERRLGTTEIGARRPCIDRLPR